MSETVTNVKKKQFLKWLTTNFDLKRRESLWILDYLFNHDIMLEKTHFVEQVDKAPRGIYMSTADNHKPAFRFYKNGHIFKDAMQAFHEIRLNWSSQLYIEIDIEDAWMFPEYLAVLEDNPYAKWNDNVPNDLTEAMDHALNVENLLSVKETLLQKIDDSLAKGEEEAFAELTESLKKINQQVEDIMLNRL